MRLICRIVASRDTHIISLPITQRLAAEMTSAFQILLPIPINIANGHLGAQSIEIQAVVSLMAHLFHNCTRGLGSGKPRKWGIYQV